MAVFETVLRSDLTQPVQVKQLSGNLFSADNNGNRITVEVTRNGEPVELSGLVSGYVIRADGQTVYIPGTIEENTASIVLPISAYAIVGNVSIVIKVGTTTVGACTAYVHRTTTDTIVDPAHVMPSIEELLQIIDDCEQATIDANAAAQLANTKAELADEKATLANDKAALADEKAQLANDKAALADDAATSANTAAGTANTAAGKIDNMTVAATGLNAGMQPTATISEVEGHKHIAFGIPKGDQGVPGKDFCIRRTFVSEEAMEAYDPDEDPSIYKVLPHDFVMIDTGDVEDPETGRLYYYAPEEDPVWRYIGDLSGKQGIKGETGTGIASITMNSDYTITIWMDDGVTSYTTTSLRGAKGETGATGPRGATGAEGPASYTYVKWSEDEPQQDSDMKDTPDKWMGIYVGTDSTAPETYTSYAWYEIKGDKGDTGDTGATGADGEDAYVYIRYSENQPTQDSDMSVSPNEWIGIYAGSSPTAPTTYTSYTWYKFKGPMGPGVPEVTSADNNKILKVVDGAWTASEAPTELPDVTSADNHYALGVVDGEWAKTDEYAPKASPVFTGSISLGRKENTTVGANSVAEGYDVTANGTHAHAEGGSTTASGSASHAEGGGTTASGQQSHAEGGGTTASGAQSHAEGAGTTASGSQSHAEGIGGTFTLNGTSYTSAAVGTADHTEGYQTLTGNGQPGNHAEGYQTRATGGAAHSEGANTFASGSQSHAEGYNTTASSSQAHAEGNSTTASGSNSHAEGNTTTASGSQSHAEGASTTASAVQAHAEGSYTTANNNQAHAEGSGTTASGYQTHAEGYNTKASGDQSHAEGYGGTFTISGTSYTSAAVGTADHTEGYMTLTASGQPGNHAEGFQTRATGGAAHSEGVSTLASGNASHAEGAGTTASGAQSHAEGSATTASGSQAHAEGYNTKASSSYSHAEGLNTTASGATSHAEGNNTTASGEESHAEGYNTTASGGYSHVSGKYNVIDSRDNWPAWVANTSYNVGDKVTRSGYGYICKTANSDSSFTSSKWTKVEYMNYAEIVGNGTATNARSNARTLDWNGNERLMGDIYVGCNADSTGGTKLDPLPAVTSSDNGKSLEVSSGVWAVGSKKIDKYYDTNDWSVQTWTGLTSFNGAKVWTDGENVYYSNGDGNQYVLDKATSTWSTKTWTGLTSFVGSNIWTDGENIYYSNSSSQYILNKATSTWSAQTWTGLTSFAGSNIWTDGENIYYSYGPNQYILDKATSTWSAKEWTGELISFAADRIWTDGENIYYSSVSIQYVLNKATSTWSTKEWTGLTRLNGNDIWTDGENVYYSNGSNQYKYNKYNKPGAKLLLGQNGEFTLVSASSVIPAAPVGMTGADGTNAGTAGYVPAPAATDNTKYLKGDGTWADVDALPAVTSSDNGKVLKVASGDWSVENEQDISGLAPKASPVFTGSISLGRYPGQTVGNGSLAVGSLVIASGDYSNAEGYGTNAAGDRSHAEGTSTSAEGLNSHTEGNGTKAIRKSQHVFGEYNKVDPSSGTGTNKGTYIEIVGNGTMNNDAYRSNARTLDWNGNERLKGDIYVGCNADSTGGTKLEPLPSVSSSDNGKFLTVVNGVWAATTMQAWQGGSY